MKVPLDQIERGQELSRLIEILPLLEELAHKYAKSKEQLQPKQPATPERESRFIRSFRQD
ncbi:MAG: hypothetical protein WC712_06270 [Candidatus Brocadiia bacterium]